MVFSKNKEDNFKNNLKSSIENILKSKRQDSKEKIKLPANPSYNQILNLVISSDSKDDWHKVSLRGKAITYFKGNVNLKFEVDYNNGIHREDFKEPWANNHADTNATSYYCNLLYSNTIIEQFILVSVDGGRAMLPLPDSRNNSNVKFLRYKVAQINDSYPFSLNEYMVRSGLTLENHDLAGGFEDGSGYGGGIGKGSGRVDGSGAG